MATVITIDDRIVFALFMVGLLCRSADNCPKNIDYKGSLPPANSREGVQGALEKLLALQPRGFLIFY
jgi:hypothetical protein